MVLSYQAVLGHIRVLIRQWARANAGPFRQWVLGPKAMAPIRRSE